MTASAFIWTKTFCVVNIVLKIKLLALLSGLGFFVE